MQPRKLTGLAKTCKSDLFAFNMAWNKLQWKVATLTLPWKNMKTNLLRSGPLIQTSTDNSLAL